MTDRRHFSCKTISDVIIVLLKKEKSMVFKTAVRLLRKKKMQNLFFIISQFITTSMVLIIVNMLNNSFYDYIISSDGSPIIFQDLNLLESLTIYENISLPLLISKNYKGSSGKKEIEEKTNAIMKKLGIEECAE